MFSDAFAVIVLLTWALVVINVRAAARRYEKDRNGIHLYSYAAALLIMGSVIIGVSNAIILRVIDCQAYLLLDAPPSIPRYHRR